MKAMVHTKYGLPEVLQLTQCEKPVPKDNEIPIRVRTSTVTAVDYRMRGFKVSLPFWPFARLRLGILDPRQIILRIELAGERAR